MMAGNTTGLDEDAGRVAPDRREFLRRGGAVVALGALGGLAAWLLSRNDPCIGSRGCAACRHRATCTLQPARTTREEDGHGG